MCAITTLVLDSERQLRGYSVYRVYNLAAPGKPSMDPWILAIGVTRHKSSIHFYGYVEEISWCYRLRTVPK